MRRLDDTIEHAYTRLLATQARYKRDFDKRIRKIKQRIRTGDYVFIDPTDGLSKTGKLQSPALGPFRVIRTDERTYVIDRNRATERVHADRVTYAPPPENAPTKDDNATTTEHLEKNTKGPTYVVDRPVTNRRTTDGTPEFLVRWYGYDEQTWNRDVTSPKNSSHDTSIHARRTVNDSATTATHHGNATLTSGLAITQNIDTNELQEARNLN